MTKTFKATVESFDDSRNRPIYNLEWIENGEKKEISTTSLESANRTLNGEQNELKGRTVQWLNCSLDEVDKFDEERGSNQELRVRLKDALKDKNLDDIVRNWLGDAVGRLV